MELNILHQAIIWCLHRALIVSLAILLLAFGIVVAQGYGSHLPGGDFLVPAVVKADEHENEDEEPSPDDLVSAAGSGTPNSGDAASGASPPSAGSPASDSASSVSPASDSAGRCFTSERSGQFCFANKRSVQRCFSNQRVAARRVAARRVAARRVTAQRVGAQRVGAQRVGAQRCFSSQRVAAQSGVSAGRTLKDVDPSGLGIAKVTDVYSAT